MNSVINAGKSVKRSKTIKIWMRTRNHFSLNAFWLLNWLRLRPTKEHRTSESSRNSKQWPRMCSTLLCFCLPLFIFYLLDFLCACACTVPKVKQTKTKHYIAQSIYVNYEFGVIRVRDFFCCLFTNQWYSTCVGVATKDQPLAFFVCAYNVSV